MTASWETTGFSDGYSMGPALVIVKPDRLIIDLVVNRWIRRITGLGPSPVVVLASDVVALEIALSWKRRRCHIVAGTGYQRREYWLSAWVHDAWRAAAHDPAGPPPV